MATYVNNLRLTELATGEGSGTWGTTTNTNLELIGEALGYGSEAIANASTHTITVADGTADSARSFYLKLTGGGQACTVTLAPNTLSKVWMVENTTNSTLTFSQGSGANVAVPAGQVKMIATDGAGSGAVVYDLLVDTDLTGTTTVVNLTSSGTIDAATVEFNSLSGTGAVAVTDILDQDDMSSNSATALATQQSIKAYVDSSVASFDTLAEVLAQGNTTGGTDIVMSAGDNITNASGDLTIDVAGSIKLDADSSNIYLADGGTDIGLFSTNNQDLNIRNLITDKDIYFQGNDGGSTITALTLDMSAAGAATFNDAVRVSAGSVGAPTITNSADTNTGLYWPSADQVGVAVAGSRKFYISSTQAFFQNLSSGVSLSGGLSAEGGAVFNDGSADVDFRVESDGNTHMLFVNGGSNQVGIGASSINADVTMQVERSGSNAYIRVVETGNTGIDFGQETTGNGIINLRDSASLKTFIGGTNVFNIASNGSAQFGFAGAALQQADSQALSIITPASGGGQGIAIKRLDTNNDQNLGEISWSNNTQDGQANIRVKTAGAANTTDMAFDISNAGNVTQVLNFDGSAGGAATFGSSITTTDIDITSTTPVIRFTETDQSDKQYQLGSFGSAFAIYDSNNSQYRYVLDTNGNHIFNEGGVDADFRVESNNNANMLFVDAGSDHVNIGTATDLGATLNVIGGTANNTMYDVMVLTGGANSTSGSGARLYISGTANDPIARGTIIEGKMTDNGNTHEINLYTSGNSAAPTRRMTIGHSEIVVNEDSLNMDFRVESDSNAHMLFVDAGNNVVSINNSENQSSFVLNVTGTGTNGGRVARFVGADTNTGTGTSAPQMVIENSNSTANNFGVLTFASSNSGTTAFIGAQTLDHTNHYGQLYFTTRGASNGYSNKVLIGDTEMVVNEDSLNYDFRVETNDANNTFFVDGGTNNIGIQSDTSWSLDGGGSASSSSGVSIDMSYDGTIYAGSAYWAGGLKTGTGFFSDASGDRYKRSSRQVTQIRQSSQGGDIQFRSQTSGTAGAVISWHEMADFGRSGVVFNDGSENQDFRVESADNANMFFMDAGGNHISIGTNTDHGGVLNVETPGQGVNIVLVCTDTDANEGPIMDFTRDAGNVPSDNDIVGKIRFRNDNTNLDMTNYVEITTVVSDVSDGTEDGQLQFNIIDGGTLRNFAHMTGGSGTVFNEDSHDLDFRVEGDSNTHALFVEGSSNIVNFGRGSSNVNSNGGYILGGECIMSTGSTANTYLLRNTSNASYSFYVSGAGQIHAVQTSISSLSDERLKENIVDLDTGLDEVMALKPRKFDWKEGEGSNEKNVSGFVAQEVETVLPNLIGSFKHDDLDDAKSVKMGDMVPTLVKAIQEQQTLIETLTARITALENV